MLAAADTADLDNGPRSKSGTERMCVVTRQVQPIDDLIRFVLSPTGAIVPDLKRKLPGRGLWISATRARVVEAARRGLFAKSFKRSVTASPTLAQDTEILLARSAVEALAMTAKARQVVSGFSKVEGAINTGQAVALIHASDGAADGIRKLDAQWEAMLRQRNAAPTAFPLINTLSSSELDLALGRSNVIHAALLAGPATKTFLARCQMLDRFRQPAEGKADDATGGRN